MSLYNILYLASGLLIGCVAGLKVIAPLTANKVDDRILERLVAVEKILEGFLPKATPPA